MINLLPFPALSHIYRDGRYGSDNSLKYRVDSILHIGDSTVTVDMAHAEGFKPRQIRGKLVKIGAKVVRHGRYITFQLAEAGPAVMCD